jgi:hypothetical protein
MPYLERPDPAFEAYGALLARPESGICDAPKERSSRCRALYLVLARLGLGAPIRSCQKTTKGLAMKMEE